jgi:hypothetical protein
MPVLFRILRVLAKILRGVALLAVLSLVALVGWFFFYTADLPTNSPQKRQSGSAFALTYRLLLRSCKLMGRVCHLTLTFLLLESLQTAGPLRSADVTPLPRYYRPSRIPLAVHRLPGVAGYTASLLRRVLDGTRRVSPVA